MAVKMLLSVSLLSWLLLFCSDCGLQGVEASSLSETFANRLDDLRSLYPKKTSIINETLFQEQKVDPRAIIEVIEIPYGGADFPDRPGAIIDLSATYSGGWAVGSVYANIDWLGTLGNILLSGGPGQVFWEITIELPDGLIALGYDIVVTLFRVVSKHFFLS
jgi:hypothetical protein